MPGHRRSGRAGGRNSRPIMREVTDFATLPGLTGALPLSEVMAGDQVSRIDGVSMSVLENIGVVFRDPVALEDRRKTGADVRGEGVHPDRGMIRTIPPDFTCHARNPARNIRLPGQVRDGHSDHPHGLESVLPAYCVPAAFDNDSIEEWQAEGRMEIAARAPERARKPRSEYRTPGPDEARDEALPDCIARHGRETPQAGALSRETLRLAAR